MEALRITAFPEKEKNAISVSTRKCGVCLEAMSKYTCPRCNLPYCSLGCFKAQKHAGCSESFYKDCFINDMKNCHADNDEKRRVMKMLRDFEESAGLQEEELQESSLEDRLRDIDLDDADEVWKALNLEEREEFKKTISSGSLVTEWKPWWQFHDMSLMTELEQNDEDPTQSKLSLPPPVNMEVPDLPTLLHGKEPSPLVRNNLLDILYCYAYHCQKYNGNVTDFAGEISRDTILSSPFLNTGVTAKTSSEAIQSAMENCSKLDMGAPERRMLAETLLDVYHILLGRDKDNVDAYVQSAICELHRCCKVLKGRVKKQKDESFDGKMVLRTMKKLEFLLSWSKHTRHDLLSLAVEVLRIYKGRSLFLDENERTKTILKKAPFRPCTDKQALLIQEID